MSRPSPNRIIAAFDTDEEEELSQQISDLKVHSSDVCTNPYQNQNDFNASFDYGTYENSDDSDDEDTYSQWKCWYDSIIEELEDDIKAKREKLYEEAFERIRLLDTDAFRSPLKGYNHRIPQLPSVLPEMRDVTYSWELADDALDVNKFYKDVLAFSTPDHSDVEESYQSEKNEPIDEIIYEEPKSPDQTYMGAVEKKLEENKENGTEIMFNIPMPTQNASKSTFGSLIPKSPERESNKKPLASFSFKVPYTSPEVNLTPATKLDLNLETIFEKFKGRIASPESCKRLNELKKISDDIHNSLLPGIAPVWLNELKRKIQRAISTVDWFHLYSLGQLYRKFRQMLEGNDPSMPAMTIEDRCIIIQQIVLKSIRAASEQSKESGSYMALGAIISGLLVNEQLKDAALATFVEQCPWTLPFLAPCNLNNEETIRRNQATLQLYYAMLVSAPAPDSSVKPNHLVQVAMQHINELVTIEPIIESLSAHAACIRHFLLICGGVLAVNPSVKREYSLLVQKLKLMITGKMSKLQSLVPADDDNYVPIEIEMHPLLNDVINDAQVLYQPDESLILSWI